MHGLWDAGIPELQDRKRWEPARGWHFHKHGTWLWTIGQFAFFLFLCKETTIQYH
jgi:hypothetical protein